MPREGRGLKAPGSPFRGRKPQELSAEDLDMATYANGRAWGRLLSSSAVADVFWGKLDGGDVAVKRFRVAGQPTHAQIDCFLATARSLPAIESPHVCRLVGSCGEAAAVVSELVPGMTLEGRLFGHRVPEDTMQWRERLRALHDTALGLEALHRAGVVHWDLHPASVIVAPDGRAVLVGWAHDLLGEALMGPGGYHGRAMIRNDERGWAYVAPEAIHRAPALLAAGRAMTGRTRRRPHAGAGHGEEEEEVAGREHGARVRASVKAVQARGLGRGPPSDVWALGVMVWEALRGKRLVETLWLQDVQTETQESVEEFRRRKRVAWQMKMRRRGWWATAVHWATFQFMLSPSLSELWLALGFEAPAGHRVQYTVVPHAPTTAHLDKGWREYGAARGLGDKRAGPWDHEGVRFAAHAASRCLSHDPAKRPPAAEMAGALALGEGEFRLAWYGALIHGQRLAMRVARGILWAAEAVLSLFGVALWLPRLGLWLLGAALWVARAALRLALAVHSLAAGLVRAVGSLLGHIRAFLLGIGAEYRLPQVLLVVAAVSYVLAKLWSRHYRHLEAWATPWLERALQILWVAHSAGAGVEGVLRRMVPGVLGNYTVFWTEQGREMGLIPVTEPLRRVLRLGP